MSEVTPFQPTIGIESIGWREAARPTLPGVTETGGMLGARVRQSLHNLYDQVTAKDIALEMTAPRMTDLELLMPHKFEAALADVIDKMEANVTANPNEEHTALAHVRQIKEARDQWRYNLVALNMA